MSELTVAEEENIRHSLGLRMHEPIAKKAHRNHFVTGPGTDDYPVMEGLVAKGFAIRRGPLKSFGDDFVYYITDAGIQAAGLMSRVGSEERINAP